MAEMIIVINYNINLNITYFSDITQSFFWGCTCSINIYTCQICLLPIMKCVPPVMYSDKIIIDNNTVCIVANWLFFLETVFFIYLLRLVYTCVIDKYSFNTCQTAYRIEIKFHRSNIIYTYTAMFVCCSCATSATACVVIILTI